MAFLRDDDSLALANAVLDRSKKNEPANEPEGKEPA